MIIYIVLIYNNPVNMGMNSVLGNLRWLCVKRNFYIQRYHLNQRSNLDRNVFVPPRCIHTP